MADGVVEVTPSTDPSAKKIDNEFLSVGGQSVYRQRVMVPDGADVNAGTTTDAAVTTDVAGTFAGKLRGLVKILASVWDSANGRLKVDGSAVTQPVSAASLPLPSGAAQEHTTAASPHAARLSDGAAFYDAAKTGQLPSALVGGRLDENLGAWLGSTAPTVGQKTMTASVPVALASDQSALPVTDNAGSLTVDAPVGTPVFARLSDGAAALIGQKVMASSLPVVIASDQSALTANGDVDHDAVNTLKNIQVAGHATPPDNPPTAVSAVGDRARIWVDRFGAQVIRRRKIRESYTAVFRLAETAARLDQTFTHVANTNKQWATLHHAATATKEIRLQKVIVWLTGATTAVLQGVIELRELSSTTAPATGNPAITPRPRRIGTGAAEATCLYLPTTQGSEAAVNSPLAHVALDWGIMGAVSTANPLGGPDQGPGSLVLFDASREDDEVFQPVAPVAVYGGWAVTTRMTAAVVVRMTVLMVFTEEIP